MEIETKPKPVHNHNGRAGFGNFLWKKASRGKKKILIQSHKNTLLLADETHTGKAQDFFSVVQLTSIYIIKMLIAI